MKMKQKTIQIPTYWLKEWWSDVEIDSFTQLLAKLSNEYANGQKLKYEIKRKRIRNPKTKKVVRTEAVLTIKWKE